MAFRAVQRWRHEHGPVFVWWWGRRPLLVVSGAFFFFSSSAKVGAAIPPPPPPPPFCPAQFTALCPLPDQTRPTDPELIRQVAVRGFKTFHDRELLAPAPQGRIFERLVREGAVFARGGYWLSVRAAVQPLFHAAALPSYCAALNDAVEGTMLRHFDKGVGSRGAAGATRGQASSGGGGEGGGGGGGAAPPLAAPAAPRRSINMSARVCDLTLKALGECVFGVPFDVGGEEAGGGGAEQPEEEEAAAAAAARAAAAPSPSSPSSSCSPLVAAAHAALEGQITGMAFGLVPPLLRPLLFALVRAFPTPGLARLAAARRVLCGVALVLSRNARRAAVASASAAAAAAAAGAAATADAPELPSPNPAAAADDDDEEERRDLRAMEREFYAKSAGARLAAGHYARALPRRGSALDCLSRARNRGERGRPLRLRHLVAQANSLLIAGHDTNGMALSAALLFLSTHPEAERALLDEVDGFYEGARRRAREEAAAARRRGGAAAAAEEEEEEDDEADADDEDGDPGARYLESADVAGACFPYAEAVLKEAVRLLPPGWMTTRLASSSSSSSSSSSGCGAATGSSAGGGGSVGGVGGSDGGGSSSCGGALPEVAGVPVPEGTLVYLDIWGVHHHPDYWPEPLAFRPERFLGRGAGSAALRAAAAAAAEAGAAATRAGGRLPAGWAPSSSAGSGAVAGSTGGGASSAAGASSLGGGGGGGPAAPSSAPAPQIAATGGGVGASSAGAHPYAWLGFGAGPRLCVGYKFAVMEAKVALVRLYRGHTFRVDEARTPLSALNWRVEGAGPAFGGGGGGGGASSSSSSSSAPRIPRLRPGVTLGFRDPLWMVPTPRSRSRGGRTGAAEGATATAAAAGSEGGAAAAVVVVRVEARGGNKAGGR